jgi:hypothetical protein
MTLLDFLRHESPLAVHRTSRHNYDSFPNQPTAVIDAAVHFVQ